MGTAVPIQEPRTLSKFLLWLPRVCSPLRRCLLYGVSRVHPRIQPAKQRPDVGPATVLKLDLRRCDALRFHGVLSSRYGCSSLYAVTTTSKPSPPDIVLLGVAWQPRALLRAQLIEEGFEVVATDSWPTIRGHFRPGAKPRLAIVDLKDLPNPRQVLDDLRVLMKPDHVLVLTAIGTVEADDI